MIKILKEGGNAFPDVEPFDHSIIKDISNQINKVLIKADAKAIPIGSGASPTPGKTSGDLDMIVDADRLANHFKSTELKDVRKQLRAMFDSAGFQTNQSGVSVHVRVPVGNSAHQVDIMIVTKAEKAAKFHTHDIPKGSPFKGVNKQIAMAYLAKKQNLLWSPYEGLWTRGPDGKKSKFYTDDLDKIAKTLLGSKATGKDLGSVEAMMAAMPDNAAQSMLADLRADKNWKELPTKESTEISRILMLSGLR